VEEEAQLSKNICATQTYLDVVCTFVWVRNSGTRVALFCDRNGG